MKLIGIILIFSIIQIPKGKCTWCASQTVEHNVETSDLIFIGNLKSFNNQSGIFYEFEIERILKNNKNIKSNKLKVISEDTVWGCGATVPQKERQLVFATWSEKEKNYKILYGDNFSIDDERNKKNLEKAKQLLKFNLENKWKWILIPIGLILFLVIGLFTKKKK